MKKRPGPMAVILFLACVLCSAALLFFGDHTYRNIAAAETELDGVLAQAVQKNEELRETEEALSAAIEAKKAALEQKRLAAGEAAAQEAEEEPPVSIFSEVDIPQVFTSSNGHVVGIDPGHQGYSVDMSDTEPMGPGSSEMKAKASTGTEGTYSGVPEYQLNLDISLKLKDVLTARGYDVIMTRTDNDTAISNAERAQYVCQNGAEIYVRIHANGDDTHTASGALTMAPSPDNPFVPQLSQESVRLSQCILDSYCAATGFQSLGVQYYDNMTGINWSTVPVTILEMGFMTHEYDDTKMNDAAFQEIMVKGIADGIDAYFG